MMDRPYDVVLYGASGFGGRQTVDYSGGMRRGGVLTPATGIGDALVERLRKLGLEYKVSGGNGVDPSAIESGVRNVILNCLVAVTVCVVEKTETAGLRNRLLRMGCRGPAKVAPRRSVEVLV